MHRTIVSTPPLPPAALAEIKQWLAISTTQDDAALAALLLTALDMCEAFTGQRPLRADITERIAADGCWQTLLSRPVTMIEASAHEVDIDIYGIGRVRARVSDQRTVSVAFTAGLADEWEALPEPLRHGAIRLAAALFRGRSEDVPAAPPAAVTALWRPFRQMAIG